MYTLYTDFILRNRNLILEKREKKKKRIVEWFDFNSCINLQVPTVSYLHTNNFIIRIYKIIIFYKTAVIKIKSYLKSPIVLCELQRRTGFT